MTAPSVTILFQGRSPATTTYTLSGVGDGGAWLGMARDIESERVVADRSELQTALMG